MSSGIGSPKPHSSRIVNSHRYAPTGVMVTSWAMIHFTRGCLRGGSLSNNTHSRGRRRALLARGPSPGPSGPSRYPEKPSVASLTLSPVERTVFPDEGVPNAQASCQLARRAAPPRGERAGARGRRCRRRLHRRRGATRTTRRARPTRTATRKSSASPTSASSAATRTTARPGSRARRASARRSRATAAARPTAPRTRSASPTSARRARTTRNARAASTA